MRSFKTDSSKAILILIILLFIVLLRLPHISNSPNEYHAWRQSDTEAIARNFTTDGLNIFLPQLNYDGPLPNYVQLELQLTTFIIALLYKAFGYHYVLARMVPLVFFIGSVYYLYRLAASLYDAKTALYTAILYGILPLNLFFSRAIMPESAALFFYIGAFLYFCEWIKSESQLHFVVSALFTALAVTQKIPAVFVCIPMLYLAVQKNRAKSNANKDKFFKRRFLTFSAISIGLPLLYFGALQMAAETDYVKGIALELILPNFGTAIFSADAQAFFQSFLYRLFTPYALILFVAGLFTIRFPRDGALLIWTLAIALEVVTIVAVIKLEYYLIFAGPIIALWGAKAFEYLSKKRLGPLIIIMCSLVLFHGWHNIKYYYQEDAVLASQAAMIEQNTAKSDLLVIGTSAPMLLNLSNRQGWRAIPGTFPSAEQELGYYINNGAKYFFPAAEFFQNEAYVSYREFLDINFQKIETEGDYFFYRLH